MFPLKPLSHDAIPGALAKAERYRLLNEPWQAESICRDILAIEPDHQAALVMLVLALTDQFDQGVHAKDVNEAIAQLNDAYERAYYSGIVDERRAMALMRQADFRSAHVVHGLFASAMDWYEKAQALRPHGNDDSLLRWNACARFLGRIPHLAPDHPVAEPAVLSE